MRLVVAVTGASGVVYAVRLLKYLSGRSDIRTVLVVSRSGELVLKEEAGLSVSDLAGFADEHYDVDDMAAPIASGSNPVDGMAVVPCSTRTLSMVAYGHSGNLIARAAEVMLKERRRLVLVVREAPLTLAHIRAMEMVTLMGGVVLPASPAFYHRPRSIDDLVDFVVGRVLDVLGVRHDLYLRWRRREECLNNRSRASDKA